jgi:hypothetical protein
VGSLNTLRSKRRESKKTIMNKNPERDAFEAFVRSGASPVPPSEIEKPLPDAFWQAAQVAAIAPVAEDEVQSVVACARRVHSKFGADNDWSEWRDLGVALSEFDARLSHP